MQTTSRLNHTCRRPYIRHKTAQRCNADNQTSCTTWLRGCFHSARPNRPTYAKGQKTTQIAAIEVPEEYMGSVVELLGKRRGQMLDMEASGPEGTSLLKYKVPTRGLIGLRNAILTASRGRAILNTIFDSYGPWAGDISSRDQGSLVAFEGGSTTSYACVNAQERGILFVKPGQDIYKGQIVGIHQRPGDLALNVCKKKAATNVRSNKETTGEIS
ncbi:hypothetical protein ACQJBY_059250 [Aegilops geniculata]